MFITRSPGALCRSGLVLSFKTKHEPKPGEIETLWGPKWSKSSISGPRSLNRDPPGCSATIYSVDSTLLSCTNALWVKLCWRVVIGGFTKMIPSGSIFLNLNYFIKNVWRSSSVQFHFWHIFGTSWTQPTAAEGFTIESVTVQAGCRKDVNEVLRTSWM